MRILVLLVTLLLAASSASDMKFDKTVHDFGKVSIADGSMKCTFTVTNTSDKPSAIFQVSTTCSCVSLKWTRQLIYPGESGTIEVTYLNNEGAQSFDKVLRVYLKDCKDPVLLHIRGVVKKNK